MARLRNITNEELSVEIADRVLGVVAPDGVLEVDDDTYLAHAWSEQVWDVVDAPPPPVDATTARVLDPAGEEE